MDDCGDFPRLFFPLDVKADIFGWFLTELAQTPGIWIDDGQGLLDGIHELMIHGEVGGLLSPLIGVVYVPMDRSAHLCRKDTVVRTTMNLYTARDWLVHKPLVP